MPHTLEAVNPPKYALDGSSGYQLVVAATMTVRNPDGEHVITTTLYGWVDRASDGRVIATIDHYPWEYVTSEPVADEQWSASWVQDHAREIVGIYGWAV